MRVGAGQKIEQLHMRRERRLLGREGKRRLPLSPADAELLQVRLQALHVQLGPTSCSGGEVVFAAHTLSRTTTPHFSQPRSTHPVLSCPTPFHPVHLIPPHPISLTKYLIDNC